MQKFLFFIITLVIMSSCASAQNDFCVSDTEHRIYNVINSIRKENNLSAIPLSHSLTFVADVHSKDLYLNFDRKSKCSMHSWSKKGRWKGCDCNKNLFKCMNSKPRELTPYKSSGYELVCYQNKEIDARELYKTWKNQSAVLNIILQRAAYSSKKWKAVGISAFEGYICVWFGEREDPDGPPPYCNVALNQEVSKAEQAEEKSAERETNANKNVNLEFVKEVSTKSCYVILGSFDNKKDAENGKKILAKKSQHPIKMIDNNGKYRLGVASRDYEEALTLRKKLKNKFPDCWIYCDKK